MQPLKVSVIMPSYNSRDTIAKSLTSLLEQDSLEPYEVIVVDSTGDDTPEMVTRAFPSVQVVAIKERKFCGAARNIGVSKARGEILALTDADCIADRNWISEIIRAHASDCPVIGGEIDNGNPESYVGWAYYFSTLTQWMPGTPRGLMRDIPTTSLSIKRWAFEKYGPFLETNYSSDTSFNWQVVSGGQMLLFEPSIKVSHINPTRLFGVLKRAFVRGFHFALVRTQAEKLSSKQRIAYALFFPVLPFLLTWRSARRVATSHKHFWRFGISLPLVFLAFVLWSLGEVLGYMHSPLLEEAKR